MSKHVDPATDKTAFTCPHCGAYTTQVWYDVRANEKERDAPHPVFSSPDEDWDGHVRNLVRNHAQIEQAQAEEIVANWKRHAAGAVEVQSAGDSRWTAPVVNCHLSKCWHCDKIAVWVHRRLVDPAVKQGALPNEDMPAEIARDFEEARSILNLSPRGAAALLRLCVEKLCAHLGAAGKSIDDKIAHLVSKGLDERVKDALDVVRVIGNNAVHDGKLDVRDNDPDLASRLLDLVNEIVEEMISKPNRLTALKGKIPQGAKDAIARRDAKAKGAGPNSTQAGPGGP